MRASNEFRVLAPATKSAQGLTNYTLNLSEGEKPLIAPQTKKIIRT